MASSNKTRQGLSERRAPDTVNRAGGVAYELSDELKLTTLILSSFNEDQFYRTQGEGERELIELAKKVDPQFSLRLAVYARKEHHMRTSPGMLVAAVAAFHPSTPYIRRAIMGVCERPDDMTNIVGFYTQVAKRKKLSAALRLGLKRTFDKFDNYALGKYSMKNREWKLIDVIRVVRPKATERNKKAMEGLVKDGKFSVETWESKVSNTVNTAVQAAKETKIELSQEEKDDIKGAAWEQLLEDNKVGYMALLRNLRNIVQTSTPNAIALATERIKDKELVLRSKQLPFRFLSARRELMKINAPQSMIRAVSIALDFACANVPKFEGRTAVCVDLSGSMESPMSKWSDVQMMDMACLFGGVLAKSNDVDIYPFASDCPGILPYDSGDTAISIGEKIRGCGVSGGTSFGSAVRMFNKPYDRVIFLSDCQGWSGGDNPEELLRRYAAQRNCRPHVVSVDLAGLGTSKFFADRYQTQISGFSEKIFELISANEVDPKAFLDKIRSIDLSEVR